MSGGADASYRAAGVDLAAQQAALKKVAKLARGTFSSAVLSEVGSFGGLFRPDLKDLDEPLLVASADGVGTKLTVARMAGDFSTVGRDLVNHCVNDILVQGGRPLFFLDYVGTGVLEPKAVVQLVEGVARGCRENGCALLGGETAEMPGFYQPGDYELVGFIVGVVERAALLGAQRVRAGDVLVGLPSAGLHTNGYSLARRILFDEAGLALDDRFPGLGKRRVRDVLLAPHLSYLRALEPLLGEEWLHALAHITGGGLTDNLPRVMPSGLGATVKVGSWEIPEEFHRLQELGAVGSAEMFRVFNMGIGMVLVVDRDALGAILEKLRREGIRGLPMGTVHKGKAGVVYELPPQPLAEEF